MKQLKLLSLILIFSVHCFAQPKFELGLTTQGSWFSVNELNNVSMKNGFGTGAGVYVSKSLVYRFSVRSGLAYQYREMKQYKQIGTSSIDGYWEKFPQHYVVVPLLLQYNMNENFFVYGGLENAWLTNYEKVYQKPEHNWEVGFGCNKHKLQWSLSYVWNAENQDFAKKSADGYNGYTYVAYDYSMFRFNLSYPLWQKK